MSKITVALVDAFAKKFEYVQVVNIFEQKDGKKKSFHPRHKEDFSSEKPYI